MGLDVWGPPETSARKAVKGVYGNIRTWNREASTTAGLLGAGNPHLAFVGSLMDWAEDHASLDEIRSEMWPLIKASRNLHFQMLTKRPERIESLLPADWGDGYENVWLGTSIENNDVAYRADHLRTIPAVVRFVSYEPALGPLDQMGLGGIDWVIYGGESGPGYRPENKQWARDMMARCRAEGVAFFHKQSAGWRTEIGIELDGLIVREFPIPRRKSEGVQFLY
jgi:protein gp37